MPARRPPLPPLAPPPPPPPELTPDPVLVDIDARENDELRVSLLGQIAARNAGDERSLALWSRRRLRALRAAYPECGPFGPFPVPTLKREP
jgi:hypothetical protein